MFIITYMSYNWHSESPKLNKNDIVFFYNFSKIEIRIGIIIKIDNKIKLLIFDNVNNICVVEIFKKDVMFVLRLTLDNKDIEKKCLNNIDNIIQVFNNIYTTLDKKYIDYIFLKKYIDYNSLLKNTNKFNLLKKKSSKVESYKYAYDFLHTVMYLDNDIKILEPTDKSSHYFNNTKFSVIDIINNKDKNK